jgi:hypothetical protein
MNTYVLAIGVVLASLVAGIAAGILAYVLTGPTGQLQ